MKKSIMLFTMIVVGALLSACGQGTTAPKEKGEKLQVVATYSIVYDIVKNVGGDLVDVHSLAPIGSDPHQYDPLPADVALTTDADVVFYNGLNLEEGNAWFTKLMETAGKTGVDAPVFRVSEGVEPMLLNSKDHLGEEDPHAWLDVRNGIKYVENVRKSLKKMDPENAERYDENADSYIVELKALHEEIMEKMNKIPEERRILVTSEGAFKYFSEAYDFNAAYIWEINSHHEGTPEQLTTIIATINEEKVQALFLETSIDPRSMEMVSRETNVPIKGKIFTDSLGKPGDDGDTYVKMLRWNADMIYSGLNK
ncbi:metal ABC transporter substrate-binding protein [Sporosarcina sp. E16_8]|uniref:metal ABC transporter substrate-binding protein n=1 Tax=Sporosarcina sp. E16_8 TaxID=2789295 RepID=UPI001A91D7D2|nr:metal ABC transporter substrate-binding protein [Sporosarcina sp. E16_8]MBO0586253.1 metal ABC transporter substrate-binding protein [Sporosarcina sp. E16_8]